MYALGGAFVVESSGKCDVVGSLESGFLCADHVVECASLSLGGFAVLVGLCEMSSDAFAVEALFN